MDSLNFTIDGHLAIPGFVRVPPPFGTPRDAVRAIKAAQARMAGRQAFEAHPHDVPLPPIPWRQRFAVATIGMACTVVAALAGSYTGQRRQPLPHFDHAPMAAIAQASTSTVPSTIPTADATPADVTSGQVTTPAEANATAPAIAAQPATTMADGATPSPAKIDKPRKLARASGHVVAPVAPAHSATSTYENSQPMESYRAMRDTFPTASGYVAPTAAVRIELQRHTRLTD